jgi:hypothetical protein
MIKINVWIKQYQYKALANLANQTGDKMAEHIRRALDNYIRKEKTK